MFKKIIAVVLIFCMSFCFASCDTKDELPEYEEQEFGLSAFWAPYDISEEGLQQYKDAGFNTLAMINHSGELTSEEQFYLGSERTMTALENCKKLGLDAILNYNDWIAVGVEGEDYYSETPFSQHDVYSEYKDIIKGIHICDEPKVRHIDEYKNTTLVNDFKKTYSNTDYVINLIPKYAGAMAYDFDSYEGMLEYYGENIMSQFDNPYISVGYYPFSNEEHHTYPRREDWLITYEAIAKTAKEYDAQKTAILQSSVSLEFVKELTEADMRLQVNMALAFGFDNLQYYCYSVPKGQYYYEYCIVDRDNKPSVLYYYLQEIHKEIQSYADVILAYDWDSVIAVNPVGFSSNMDMSVMMRNEFKDTQYYDKAIASTDLVITRFTSDKYGEAYMLVNYAQKDKNNIATVTFKNCERVAVYGGKGFDGTPEIVELDEENKYRVDLAYGEGVFVVPMA